MNAPAQPTDRILLACRKTRRPLSTNRGRSLFLATLELSNAYVAADQRQ